ncbi:MAG TPA: hypothetical protein VFV50_04530 [Bdellovibrionales bacterium]|nr:hypothetical protein [Bdellovibrionales bacterium]
MTLIRALITAVLLWSAGCASAPKVSGVAPKQRETLLPNGTYRHSVRLSISLSSGRREFTLDGVVSTGEKQIQVVGLSLFGTTEFRITDNLDDNRVTVEIYRDGLKRAENKIREYYATLRLFLTAKAAKEHERILIWAQTDGGGRPVLLRVPGASTEFRPASYDHNGIPMSLEIKSDSFDARIKVTAYEI